MCTKRRRIARRKGFTLIEIMIVIVIIGLLAGLVTVNVRGYLLKARQNAARAEIQTIVQALDTFDAAYSRYPTNEEGLEILTKPSDKMPEPLLKGRTMDPWQHPYQYVSPGSSAPFEVISYGADGREGGDGANADISSADLKEAQ